MSDFGVMNPEDYFTSTSAGSNISAMSNMLSLMGNPLFLYTQGVITPEMLLKSIRESTSEVVDLSGGNFRVMEEAGAEDPALATGFEMIKRGYSIPAIMRTLSSKSEENGELSDLASKNLEYLQEDLEEYKKRWDVAQDAMNKVESGEYYYDGDVLRGRMETGKAMDVLAQMGLPKYLQNPMMWEVVPDQDLIDRALKKDEEAESILKSLSGILDPMTGALTPSTSRKLSKEASKTGVGVYQDFLKKTPEGQKLLKEVTTGKTNVERGQEAKSNLLKNALSVFIPGSGAVKGIKRNIDLGIGGVKRIGNLVGIGDDKKKSIVAQNPDYWAKQAGSYAARAKYEEQRKPLSDIQKRVEAAKIAAEKIRQQAVEKGREQNASPALGFIQQALPMAQMLTAPAPRAVSVSAPRRSLSDAEIDQMSSMLAYGGNA